MKPQTPVIPGMADHAVARGADVGQPQYIPLPIVITDKGEGVTFRFKLEEHELAALNRGASLYITTMTNGMVVPIRVQVLDAESTPTPVLRSILHVPEEA